MLAAILRTFLVTVLETINELILDLHSKVSEEDSSK